MFIALHHRNSSEKFFVALDKIISFENSPYSHEAARLTLSTGHYVFVTESVEEILEILKYVHRAHFDELMR